MNRYTPLALLLAGTLAIGVGCKMGKDKDSSKSDMKKMDTKTAGKSLWDRLGGEPAVSTVVEDFVARGADDKRVNFTRQGHPNQWDPSPANMKKLKRRLVEFISMASGGPIKYTGRDMVTSHTGMNITEAEFNALAAHLSAALDKAGVGANEKNELMAAVGATKGQIVGK